MTQIHRVLIPINSHDPEAWRFALAYAKKICEANRDSVRNIVLLVHTKTQLNRTDLAGHIGLTHAKALDRGNTLTLSSGVGLRCETLRTIQTGSPRCVVIAYWADMKMLDVVDGLRSVAGVVAVPEFDSEVNAWEERWSPIVHGRAVETAPATLIDDPVVEKALETLNMAINRSTGLGHPRDNDRAKEIFQILRNKGHRGCPEKIKSWAIRHGWRPAHAAELAALAQKVFGQKTKPSLSGIFNAEERYQRWR